MYWPHVERRLSTTAAVHADNAAVLTPLPNLAKALKKHMHAQHKLGSTNKESIYLRQGMARHRSRLNVSSRRNRTPRQPHGTTPPPRQREAQGAAAAAAATTKTAPQVKATQGAWLT